MKPKIKKILLWILDLSINIVIIIGLVLVIQKWFIAPFDVSGASMCDTLNYVDEECQYGFGEKIIINEAIYLISDPERGDIVVFKTGKDEDKFFIKRIIGLPGEVVEIKNGEVYVENEKLEENYLNEKNKGNTQAYFSDLSVFEVPEDHYLVFGDNRKESTDSRSCFSATIIEKCTDTPEKSFIHKDLIRGKAWVVWWPLSNIRTIDKIDYNISESLEEK